MSFADVLSDVIEEDNGLLLRVTAHERMMETNEASRGRSAWIPQVLRRRSGKITEWAQRLRTALDGRNGTCP
ncbi:MAG: hypothetical protein CL931_15715 [Deltaproteobacteria bacterium]|nr:hypothetical protein [Deltaproteobacteria bacterium]